MFCGGVMFSLVVSNSSTHSSSLLHLLLLNRTRRRQALAHAAHNLKYGHLSDFHLSDSVLVHPVNLASLPLRTTRASLPGLIGPSA